MSRSIQVTGTLVARERSTLSSKASGRLQSLNVDLGSVVQQGDLLAQVEPRDFELGLQQATAALAQARAAIGLPAEGENDRLDPDQVSTVKQAKAVLDEAESSRERIQKLYKSGIASQSEVDTAEAAYKVAFSKHEAALEEARTRVATVTQRRAEYELARKRLADASLRAPFSGVVQARLGHVGEYVAPGTPILELVQTDPLRLRLEVPERVASLVRTGQVVQLSIESDTNVYAGHIRRMSAAVDEQTRMLVVEADVPAQGPLRPGFFARAKIVVNEGEQGLRVPAGALITFAGIEKVVIPRDGKALERVVQTGRRGPGWVEILGGLQAGDEVILNPEGLRTGQPVQVTSSSRLDFTQRDQSR